MAPATILLMRHAEKPGAPDDPHLSQEGRRRAEKLARYIPEEFGRPDFLFAASGKPSSRRPKETLEPLAAATGLPIDDHASDKHSEAFAGTLLSDPQYDGASIVVSWRHDALPTLAYALGAKPGEVPNPWPDDLYGLILRFDYEEGGPEGRGDRRAVLRRTGPPLEGATAGTSARRDTCSPCSPSPARCSSAARG
jgi:hypothetical protein